MGGNITRKRREVLEVFRERTRWKQFSRFVRQRGASHGGSEKSGM